jgi:hypothetical protein
MFEQSSESEKRGGLRPWRFFPIGLALALIYLGFTFFTRWQENRRIDEAAREKAAAQQAAEARRTVEAMGGNRFEILGFYASPGVIARGESAELCYGVSKAESVSIEPYVGKLWPSYSRCVSISPRTSTRYTLTARDAEGHSETATTMVKVK